MSDTEALFDVPRHWWHFRSCQTCGGWLKQNATHTYVVQRQGWVKIGSTRNVRRRLNELARPAWTQHLLSPDAMDWLEPLVTIAVLEEDVEHELHERFEAAHVLGEWFLPDASMRDWLATL